MNSFENVLIFIDNWQIWFAFLEWFLFGSLLGRSCLIWIWRRQRLEIESCDIMFIPLASQMFIWWWLSHLGIGLSESHLWKMSTSFVLHTASLGQELNSFILLNAMVPSRHWLCIGPIEDVGVDPIVLHQMWVEAKRVHEILTVWGQ